MAKIIETKLGLLEGVDKGTHYIYKGIPYAKPPVGVLRFHAPVPVTPWEGIFKADKFSNRAIQRGQNEGDFYYKEFFDDPQFVTPMSEDCLYLNIWTPKEIKEKLPVAIYIHGGGFFNGHSFEKEMDGEAYAKRGVILVTINYRLGMLGFFAHPDLTKRDGSSGNYGLLDQIEAIKWVKNNIDAFGGDSENITIFGQSAGGRSVEILCALPCTKGLFQHAIMQSSGGYIDNDLGTLPRETIEKCAKSFLRFRFLDIEKLMKMPADKFVALNYKFARYVSFKVRHGYVPGSPSICPELYPYTTNHAVDHGLMHDIDYMIGGTKNDIFVSKKGSQSIETNEMMQGVIKFATKMSKTNRCYVYYFAHDLPGDHSGAFHSGELWYMFGTLGRCFRPFTDADYKLSDEMIDSWTGFMKNGDPGFEKYTEKEKFIKVFK